MKTNKKTNGGFPFKEHTNFPSRYKHGEKVMLNLFNYGKIPAKITKIHFSESSIFYDLEIYMINEKANECKDIYTRIHNIESIHVCDYELITNKPK